MWADFVGAAGLPPGVDFVDKGVSTAMRISLRGWLLLGGCTALIAALAIWGASRSHAEEDAIPRGQLTQESLGNLLSAMGLQPKKLEQRYDFNFRTTIQSEEWELSMSATLSENGESIWIMAWLDELPTSAADVSRAALLRMLADNDRLGQGKFFAYIPGNRRFVLEQAIPNQNITTARMRRLLLDLGTSVVQTYPHWNAANWKVESDEFVKTAAKPPSSQGQIPTIHPAAGRHTDSRLAPRSKK